MLVATRLSLVLALLATAVSIGAGHHPRPAAAPCSAGRAARTAHRLINMRGAFPGLLLALFFASSSASVRGAVLAIGLAGAPAFARLSQTLVAAVTARDYVAAARIAGVGRVPAS